MTAKQLIRQFRAGSQKKTLPPLIHLCINLKSRDKYAWQRLKKTLIDKAYHREYGIKNKVVQDYSCLVFEPHQERPLTGNKTYLHKDSGKFVSNNPEFDEYPF